MSNRQNSKRRADTPDTDPAAVAAAKQLEHLRRGIARRLLKRRRQKSHQ